MHYVFAAEFIKRQTKAQNVWISIAPTWPNHNAIFNAVGMTIREYRYYDAERKVLDWKHLLEDLSQTKRRRCSAFTVAATTQPVLPNP